MNRFNPMELALIKLPKKIDLIQNDKSLVSPAIFPVPFINLEYLDTKMQFIDRNICSPINGRAYNMNCMSYYRNTEYLGVIECSDGSFYLYHPDIHPEPEEENWEYIQAIAKGSCKLNSDGSVGYTLTHVYVVSNTIPEMYKSSKVRYIASILLVILLSAIAIFALCSETLVGFSHLIVPVICAAIQLPIVISLSLIKYLY